MKSQLIKKVYYFEQDNDGKLRNAEITFKRKYNTLSNWELSICEFWGVRQGIYTIDDWKFLGELAKEVVELEKELNKGEA